MKPNKIKGKEYPPKPYRNPANKGPEQVPILQPISRLPKANCNSLSSVKDIVNE